MIYDFGKLLSTFVNSVALVMALVLLISLMKRSGRGIWTNTVVMGGVFSLAVLFTMSDPINLPSSVKYDMRTLLIGAGVALLGPVVGFMAFITALTYRWGIGGPAVFAGLAAIVLSFSGGVLWRYAINKRPWKVWKKTLLLGVMISANGFAIFLLPQAAWGKLLYGLVPYILVSHIVGCFLLTYLIRGELSFLSEAESSKIEANTDHLTGLLNRRGLDMVYPELATLGPDKRGRALLYFDIDRFKSINDSHGHGVGDSVLRYVTEEVANNLRPQDVFARIGGDEFAIVLNKIDPQEAERIAERCRSVIGQGGFENNGKELAVSISIGGIWMLDHSEIDDILDEADDALYEAKSGGRNKVVFRQCRDILTKRPAILSA